jgi:hypothetical protein
MTPRVLGMASLCLFAAFCFTSRQRHRRVAIWLIALLVVPYWATVGIGNQSVPYSSASGMVLLLAIRPGRGRIRVVTIDRLVMSFLILALTAVLLGLSEGRDARELVGHWVVFYLLGRIVGVTFDWNRLEALLARLGAGLGAAAILEFAFSVHPFTALADGSTSAAIWAPIQSRGGLTRSELSMGHSIALGCVLAMLVPFVLAHYRSSFYRLAAVAIICGGALSTFSRTGIASVVIAILWTLFFVRIPSGFSTRLLLGGAGLFVLVYG